MKIRQNQMLGYLAVTAGVGCAASTANAAVMVTSYNPGLTTTGGLRVAFSPGQPGFLIPGGYDPITGKQMPPTFFPPTPSVGYVNIATQGSGTLASRVQRGTDTTAFFASNFNNQVIFATDGLSQTGALLNSTDNFIGVDFGNNGSIDTIAQIELDGQGGGKILAIVTTDEAGRSLTAPEAFAAISNPVPEPSGLALLALGATGLVARRQRKKAA